MQYNRENFPHALLEREEAICKKKWRNLYSPSALILLDDLLIPTEEGEGNNFIKTEPERYLSSFWSGAFIFKFRWVGKRSKADTLAELLSFPPFCSTLLPFLRMSLILAAEGLEPEVPTPPVLPIKHQQLPLSKCRESPPQPTGNEWLLHGEGNDLRKKEKIPRVSLSNPWEQ